MPVAPSLPSVNEPVYEDEYVSPAAPLEPGIPVAPVKPVAPSIPVAPDAPSIPVAPV